MNKSTKLKIVKGIQILLVVFTILFLLGLQSSKNQFEQTSQLHVGIVLLLLGTTGLIGSYWKKKMGFFLSLTYQYLILLLIIMGLIASQGKLRPTIILSITALCMIISLKFFNDVKSSYGVSTKGIAFHIMSSLIGLLLSATLLLYLA